MRRLRALALVLTISLPFVSGASVFAGAMVFAPAGPSGHRVSLRLCDGASFDVVLAHAEESERAGTLGLPDAGSDSSLGTGSCGARDAAAWDHVLRCAAMDGSAAPERALDARSAPIAAIPSVELVTTDGSTESSLRMPRTDTPDAAIQRSVVLRI